MFKIAAALGACVLLAACASSTGRYTNDYGVKRDGLGRPVLDAPRD